MRGKWTLLTLLALSACSDHRAVVRVCLDGTLIVRDGSQLKVVRPRHLGGWDVEPGLSAAQLCSALSLAHPPKGEEPANHPTENDR